jgi:hypothetical protein
MNDRPFYMKCGHTTYATLEPDNRPICTSCLCMEIVEKPDVSCRTAQCSLCGRTDLSTHVQETPFFRHRADMPTDSFYCGCEGWS